MLVLGHQWCSLDSYHISGIIKVMSEPYDQETMQMATRNRVFWLVRCPLASQETPEQGLSRLKQRKNPVSLRCLLLVLLTALSLTSFGLAVVSLQLSSPSRLIISFAGTAVMSANGLILRKISSLNSRKNVLAFFLLVLIVLTPIWTLYSIVSTLYLVLGIHFLTLISMVLIYGVPILVAWRLTHVPSRRVMGWLANVLIAMISVGLTVGGIEVGLRFLGFGPASHDTRRQTVGSCYQADETLGHVLQPNCEWGHRYPSNERGYFDEDNTVFYHTNAAGFRDEEFVLERDQSTIRIAFLGDSFGHGSGVKYRDMVTTLLESLLSERAGCPVAVYNFSVPGYSTTQEARLLEHTVMDYQPDVVVVWYFLNDPLLEGTLRVRGMDEVPLFLPTMRRFSAIAQFIGARLDAELITFRLRRTWQEAYSTSDPRWLAVMESLQRMASLSRQRETPIVLFVHPTIHHLGANYPFADLHRQVITTAQDYGFIAYDLFEAFEGQRAEDLWVHQSDHHPNDIAHAITARYAAERLSAVLPPCSSRQPAGRSETRFFALHKQSTAGCKCSSGAKIVPLIEKTWFLCPQSAEETYD